MLRLLATHSLLPTSPFIQDSGKLLFCSFCQIPSFLIASQGGTGCLTEYYCFPDQLESLEILNLSANTGLFGGSPRQFFGSPQFENRSEPSSSFFSFG
jgi:hypothetical protein